MSILKGIPFLRQELTKIFMKRAADKSGIMQIPFKNKKLQLDIEDRVQKYIRDAEKQGVDLDMVSNQNLKYTIKLNENTDPISRIISADSEQGRRITNMLLGKRGEVVDMTGKKLDTSQGIMGGKSVTELMESGQVTKGTEGLKKSKKVQDREMFENSNLNKTDAQIKAEIEASNKKSLSKMETNNFSLNTITKIKSMKPMDAMKEANLVAGKKGRYANLDDNQVKKIIDDTTDHIFERDIPIDPEDMADGGRTGFKDGKGEFVSKVPKFYTSREDIPENILAMLEKDPNFNLESFLNDFEWSSPHQTALQLKMKGESDGLSSWGFYIPETGKMKLNYQKFGKSEPIAGGLLSSKHIKDKDKVQTILHEMRHKKFDEPWFKKSSAVPEYVRKETRSYSDEDLRGNLIETPYKETLGEELYTRFLDQHFGDVAKKGDIAGSEYKPYFDKILKDHWAPNVKAYKDILKEEKRVKSKPYGLADGGVAGLLGERTESTVAKPKRGLVDEAGSYGGLSNWLYTGAAPGTQAATKTLAQTTPWRQVGKQVLAEGGYGFGSNNKGFNLNYTGKGATKNPFKYTYEGAKSFGAKVPGNIGGGTPAGRLAFEKALQSPFAKGVGIAGRYASPLGWGATAGQSIGWLTDKYAKATNTPEAYDYLKSMGGANFNFDETNLDVGDIYANIRKLNQNKNKKQKQADTFKQIKETELAKEAAAQQAAAQQAAAQQAAERASIQSRLDSGSQSARERRSDKNVGGGQGVQSLGTSATARGSKSAQGYSQHAEGGIARQNFSMGKRAFLKWMAGTGAGIGAAKSGLFGLGKGVTKKAVTETVKQAAGSGGQVPPYFLNLVKKIKTLGDDTLATQDKAIAKKYKDYTMEEDFAGNIEIIKKGDDVAEDVFMSYKVDDVPVKGKKKSTKVEEYEEYTARPDRDGKMKDIEPGVPDEVVQEGTIFEDTLSEFGKADGGRVPLAGGGGLFNVLKLLLKRKPKLSYLEKYPRVDIKELMKGDKPIKLYSGVGDRQVNTLKAYKELAKYFNTTVDKVKKDNFKGQWFTPFKEYASSFGNARNLNSKMLTTELTPKEIKMAKRYVNKINKKDRMISKMKMEEMDNPPKYNITTSDNTVIIPKIKLKKLKKEGKIDIDYMVLEKIKSKLGLSTGGIARMLGE